MSLINACDFMDVKVNYNVASKKAKQERMVYYADEAIDHFTKLINDNRDAFLSELCRKAKLMGGTGVNCVDTPIKVFTVTQPDDDTPRDKRTEIRQHIDRHIDEKTGVYYESPILRERVSLLDIAKKSDFLRRLEAVISDDPHIYLWLKRELPQSYDGAVEIDCEIHLCMRMRGEVPESAKMLRKYYVDQLREIRSQVTY